MTRGMKVKHPGYNPSGVYPGVPVLVLAIYKIICKIDFAAVEMLSITNAREQVWVPVLDFSWSSFAPK